MADASTETRLDVATKDSTIATWVDGAGPPLVLVHGSLQDHTASRVFVDELISDFTTYAVDRRGFGASPDTASWTIEDDFADLHSVIDQVAKESGRTVGVWGHSFGANVVMGAAARSDVVGGLVLYEPSFGMPFPEGSIETVADLVASGDREGAVAHYLGGLLTKAELADLRSSARWPEMVVAAHTIAREALVERDWRIDDQFDSLTAPTLMLTGSDTAPSLAVATRAAAAAIGRPPVIKTLEGHGHFAHRTEPALVAGIVREFLRPLDRAIPQDPTQ